MIARPRSGSRRGSLLIETAMASLLLMAALAIVTKVMAAVALERRAWDRRQVAAFEAAGVMERLSARPFDALKVGRVEGLALSSEAARSLPSGELSAEVLEDDDAGGPGSKWVHLRIRWRNRAGDWDAPVRLTTWFHRRKEGAR